MSGRLFSLLSPCLGISVFVQVTMTAFLLSSSLLTAKETAFQKGAAAYAKDAVRKAMTYAYRDRKNRKREFRRLWILRINNACRENGLTYSRFIEGLVVANVEVDRKVMADLAVTDMPAFAAIVEQAKAGLERKRGEQPPLNAAKAA